MTEKPKKGSKVSINYRGYRIIDLPSPSDIAGFGFYKSDDPMGDKIVFVTNSQAQAMDQIDEIVGPYK